MCNFIQFYVLIFCFLFVFIFFLYDIYFIFFFFFFFFFYFAYFFFFFFFSSRRRHTRYIGDWSSDVCSSDLTGTFTLRLRSSESTSIPVMSGSLTSSVTRSGLSIWARPSAVAPSSAVLTRSEERRVGKECRSGGWPED